jgi:DNA-binding transcriptional MerR regulator
MKKELFSIGEASTMTGLSVYTLRRLEGKGLVTFKRINGRRYISAKELRAAQIRRMDCKRAKNNVSL